MDQMLVVQNETTTGGDWCTQRKSGRSQGTEASGEAVGLVSGRGTSRRNRIAEL
jgi:hypothetical protein